MSSRPDPSLNFTRELRSRAASGASGAELARWLQQQLGPRFTVILFHWNFLHAFGIPLETLRRSTEDWAGLGPPGALSATDLDRLLGPWIHQVSPDRPKSGPKKARDTVGEMVDTPVDAAAEQRPTGMPDQPPRVWTAQDIPVVTSAEFLRRHPHYFFPSGAFNVPDVIKYLVHEALACGVTQLVVRQLGPWWVVSSEQDWLPEVDPLASFHAFVPYTDQDPLSVRAECSLTVFASDVVTASPAGVHVLKGTIEPSLDEAIAQSRHRGRLVAFRL